MNLYPHGKECLCFSCIVHSEGAYTPPMYQVGKLPTDIVPMPFSSSGRQNGKNSMTEALKNNYVVLPNNINTITTNKKTTANVYAYTQSGPSVMYNVPSGPPPSWSVRIPTWKDRAEEAGEVPKQRMVGHVYGLRSFSFTYGRNYLEGLWYGRWYSPRQNAKCKPHGRNVVRHRERACKNSPGYNCLCGINMYKLTNNAEMKHNFTRMSERYYIVGIVKGWGRTIEHEDGYRVQKALIVALYCQREEDLKQLQKIFQGQKREPLYTSNYHEMLDWVELYKAQDEMNKESTQWQP